MLNMCRCAQGHKKGNGSMGARIADFVTHLGAGNQT